MKEEDWDGIRRKYWHGRETYYLPIVTWKKKNEDDSTKKKKKKHKEEEEEEEKNPTDANSKKMKPTNTENE